MTRRLPHIGLGGEQRSLYGENSTIGEQGKRERRRFYEFMAAAIADAADDIRAEAARMKPHTLRRDLIDEPRDPIRVQAYVGDAIPELTSDA